MTALKTALPLMTKTADPTTPTPAEGQVYWNSSTQKLRVYTSGAWVDVGNSTIAFGPNSQALTVTYATITYVTTLTTGSWLVQIDADNIIYTGNMTWKTGSVSGNAASEIVLNASSLTSPSYTINARIYADSTDNTQKFQLCASSSITVTNLYLTFRKLI